MWVLVFTAVLVFYIEPGASVNPWMDTQLVHCREIGGPTVKLTWRRIPKGIEATCLKRAPQEQSI